MQRKLEAWRSVGVRCCWRVAQVPIFRQVKWSELFGLFERLIRRCSSLFFFLPSFLSLFLFPCFCVVEFTASSVSPSPVRMFSCFCLRPSNDFLNLLNQQNNLRHTAPLNDQHILLNLRRILLSTIFSINKTNQPTNQPTQPSSQSSSQPTNQPTNQPNHLINPTFILSSCSVSCTDPISTFIHCQEPILFLCFEGIRPVGTRLAVGSGSDRFYFQWGVFDV